MARFNKHKHQKAQKTLAVKKQRKPKFIDRLVYVAAIVEPLCSLPQAYAVWSTRSAGSVSILSWLGFVVMGLLLQLSHPSVIVSHEAFMCHAQDSDYSSMNSRSSFSKGIFV